ncbi:conserved hypothetical protein [Streptococcus agalactiae COH1]|nr:conserved hypothetical protein [Streptococcus agalactiae COH1]
MADFCYHQKSRMMHLANASQKTKMNVLNWGKMNPMTFKSLFDQQQRCSVYMSDIEKIVFAPMQDLM